MDYELAKKLKNAGFPHKPFSACQAYVGEDGKVYPYGTTYEGKVAELPTLSELIAACGDGLESIIQRGNGDGDNWEVRSKTTRYNATTLEEAVANLWLALNEKNPNPHPTYYLM